MSPRTWAAFALLLAATLPARAQQAGASCEVADFTMTMRFYIPLTSGQNGSPAAEPMQGSLDIHHQKIPKERRSWSLDGKRPAQFWNYGGTLKVLFLLGSEPEHISILIETAQVMASGEYTGTFRLLTGDLKLSGRLACTVG